MLKNSPFLAEKEPENGFSLVLFWHYQAFQLAGKELLPDSPCSPGRGLPRLSCPAAPCRRCRTAARCPPRDWGPTSGSPSGWSPGRRGGCEQGRAGSGRLGEREVFFVWQKDWRLKTGFCLSLQYTRKYRHSTINYIVGENGVNVFPTYLMQNFLKNFLGSNDWHNRSTNCLELKKCTEWEQIPTL